MKATDKSDYGTCRECHGACVYTGIGFGDFCDIHVLRTLFCLAFAQEVSVFDLLAVVEQSLQIGAVRVKRACVAYISIVQINGNLEKHRVKRQVYWTGCLL